MEIVYIKRLMETKNRLGILYLNWKVAGKYAILFSKQDLLTKPKVDTISNNF